MRAARFSVAITVIVLARSALAQTPAPPAPAPVPTAAPAPAPPSVVAPAPAPAPEGRPARVGFQAALRTGLSIPTGKATATPGDSLGARYSSTWLWQVDLGAKVTEAVLLGVYTSVGLGFEGSDQSIEEYCDDDDDDFENDIVCTAASLRFGAQLQYHFGPDQKLDPWLGYGIGWEYSALALSDQRRNFRETNHSWGVTYAKLDGGLDFRWPVGFGVYGEAALGRFTSTSTRVNQRLTYSGDVPNPAFHAWLTLGIRGVLLP